MMVQPENFSEPRQRLYKLLRGSAEIDRTLFELQLRLFPVLARIGLAVVLLGIVRTLLTKAEPLLPQLISAAAILAADIIVAKRPTLVRPAVRVVVVLSMILTLGMTFWWQSGTAPPTAIFFLLVCLAATTLDGILLGTSIYLAGAVFFVAILILTPDTNSLMFRSLSNLLVAMSGLQAGAVTVTILLQRLIGRYRQQGHLLEAEETIRETLLEALFNRVGDLIQRFEESMKTAGQNPQSPALNQALAEVQSIHRVVSETRDFASEEPEDQKAIGSREETRRIRTGVLIALNAFGIAFGAVNLFRALSFETYPWWQPVAAIASSALLLMMARKPASATLAGYLTIALLTAAVLFSTLGELQSFGTDANALNFIVVAFFAFLILGMTPAAVVAAVGMATLLYSIFSGAGIDSTAQQLTANIALTLTASLAWCFAIGAWMRELAARLDDRAEDLRAERDLRRRLMSTLFHDLRNPLGVAMVQLDARSQGLEMTPQDMERVARMGERMRDLVDNARRYQVDHADPKAAMKNVTIQSLFDASRDLFSDRMQEKGIRLRLTAGSDLWVRALAEIMRDSVLSNMLANSIEFSPQGSSIEMVASDEGAMVKLCLLDQGDDFPESLIDSLKSRDPVETRLGLAGRRGDGQGLRQAALYLEKMGGRLEIANRKGGTEMCVFLRKGRPTIASPGV